MCLSHQRLRFTDNQYLQHVGSKYYNTYFRLIDFALKSKNATAIVSSTTCPEFRYSEYQCVSFDIHT